MFICSSVAIFTVKNKREGNMWNKKQLFLPGFNFKRKKSFLWRQSLFVYVGQLQYELYDAVVIYVVPKPLHRVERLLSYKTCLDTKPVLYQDRFCIF